MTVEEYIAKEAISVNALANRIGVNPTTVWNVIAGKPCRAITARKFNKLGIDVELVGGCEVSQAPCELKQFQIDCVRNTGSTIVSRKNSEESIIKAYADEGLAVEVHDFKSVEVVGGDTHYVVRLVGATEC